ncbi:MAG: hypothetical protein ACREDR_20410 [Blastocatellia bacterium]
MGNPVATALGTAGGVGILGLGGVQGKPVATAPGTVRFRANIRLRVRFVWSRGHVKDAFYLVIRLKVSLACMPPFDHRGFLLHVTKT